MNITIQNVRPNSARDNRTFIAYSAYFSDDNHTINGDLAVDNNDIKQAESDANGDVWAGFKALVQNRLQADVKAAVAQPAPAK